MRELWPFNAFVILKTTFSKQRLIKISMMSVYIKPEVIKNDATEMTTATSETYIG